MIDYQYYSNNRDYHESFTDSKLHNQITEDINSILFEYNNNCDDNTNPYDNRFFSSTSNNVYDKSNSSSDLINFDNIDQLFTDTLSDNEIDFIKEIFDDNSSATPISILPVNGVSIDNSRGVRKKNKSSDETNKVIIYQQHQKERSSQLMKRVAVDILQALYTCVLPTNPEELSRKIYQILHPKCLVRFKLTNISAKSGPKSLVDYFNLLKNAFPDGKRSFMKEKFFITDGYHVSKRKFVFIGTESSYEDSFNYFSYCCNIKDILYLKDREDNFIPNQYRIKFNVTRYVDPLIYKVVLCDIGLDVVSQKFIQ